jgi:hypothetical protein
VSGLKGTLTTLTFTDTSLPKGVTATLVDEGPDKLRIYRLKDGRGYTGREDLVRIGRGNGRPGWGYGDLEKWTQGGWVRLFAVQGAIDGSTVGPIDDAAAIRRAVKVLYGLEDHG